MDAYTSFSQVYDLFMDNVPYEEWAEYIKKQLTERGIKEGTVVDLGCGTGKLTRIMAQMGYDMIGVDNAPDMLDIAYSYESEDILYLLQDMRELELYAQVKAVYSACDCLNYILEEEDLLAAFERVYSCMEEDGVFIFDMNTEYKYSQLLAEYTFAENRDEGSFIWENYYDEEDGINQYDLTLFILDDTSDKAVYHKFEETHFQKSYKLDTVLRLLKNAGFTCEAVYEGYTIDQLSDESDRMTIIARK